MDLLTRTLLRQYDSEPSEELAYRLVALLRRQIGGSSSEKEDSLISLLLQINKEMEQHPLQFPEVVLRDNWVREQYRPMFKLIERLYYRLQDLPEEELDEEEEEGYVPHICPCGCGLDLAADIYH